MSVRALVELDFFLSEGTTLVHGCLPRMQEVICLCSLQIKSELGCLASSKRKTAGYPFTTTMGENIRHELCEQ